MQDKDKTKDPVKGDSKPVTENKPVTEKPRNFADVSNDQDRQMAIDAGVFGAPSYLLDGEIFWGQDRLDFVERALAL